MNNTSLLGLKPFTGVFKNPVFTAEINNAVTSFPDVTKALMFASSYGANLWKAISIFAGNTPAGETYHVAEDGDKVIVEYNDTVREVSKVSYLMTLDNTTNRYTVSKVSTNTVDGKVTVTGLTPLQFSETNNEIVGTMFLLGQINYLSNSCKKFSSSSTLKNLGIYARKDILNPNEWTEAELKDFAKKILLVEASVSMYFFETIKHSIASTEDKQFVKLTDSTFNKINANFANYKTLIGTTELFAQAAVVATAKDKKNVKKDANGYFVQDPSLWLNPERTRSEWALQNIPKLKGLSIPEWVWDTYDSVVTTFGTPFRNFYWKGSAGTGKTTGARQLAFLLGLPYGTIVCAYDTEIGDFMGKILPVDNSNNASSAKTYDEVIAELGVDFEMLNIKEVRAAVYQQFTGIEDPNVSFSEVSKVLTKEIAERLGGSNSSSQGVAYKYVETPLIKVLREGGVCEIQELSIIANAGVAVGLNELMTTEGLITLPNGETFRRHKDAIIVFTTNGEYEGCNEINESVLSRMHEVLDFPSLTVSEMKKRAIATYGKVMSDDILTAMAECIVEGRKFSEEDMSSAGVCGYREYLNWIELILKKTEGKYDPDHYLVVKAAEKTVKHKLLQARDLVEGWSLTVLKPLDKVNWS